MAHAGFAGKIIEQHQHIFTPLTQGGDAQGRYVEAVIQVGAEAALIGGLAQVFLGGGDHPDIQRDQLVPTQALDHALLQQTQQFDLHVQAHALDFVEEQGAAIGELELANAPLLRAGKGPRLMPEQFAFNHGFSQGPGIDRHKRAVTPRR